MLQDSASIQERDIQFINKQQGTSREPLYTMDDARAATALFKPVPYHQVFQAASNLQASFHDAGHMLGSALVKLESEGKRIVFSGDLGRASLPILKSPELLSGADTVILESTYGNRVHPPEENEEKELAEIIRTVAGRRGKILVPAFAVGRTQHLTYRLKRLAGGSRRSRSTSTARSPPTSPRSYRRHPVPRAGDLDAGRPLRHAPHGPHRGRVQAAQRPEGPRSSSPRAACASTAVSSTTFITTALTSATRSSSWATEAEHTLGRRILEGRKDKVQEIRVHGRPMTFRAQVFKMNGLSATPTLRASRRSSAPTPGRSRTPSSSTASPTPPNRWPPGSATRRRPGPSCRVWGRKPRSR